MLTIKFTDGEMIQNVPWLSLPNKRIHKIKYCFNGKKILMENYEAYNHLVEKTFNMFNGATQIRSVYLMGRKGGISQIVRLNMIDKTIQEYKTEINKEYGAVNALTDMWINGRPSTGWKDGVLNLEPNYQIV